MQEVIVKRNAKSHPSEMLESGIIAHERSVLWN